MRSKTRNKSAVPKGKPVFGGGEPQPGDAQNGGEVDPERVELG